MPPATPLARIPALTAWGLCVRTTGPPHPAGFPLSCLECSPPPSLPTVLCGNTALCMFVGSPLCPTLMLTGALSGALPTPISAHQPCPFLGASLDSAFRPHLGPLYGSVLWSVSSAGSNLAWLPAHTLGVQTSGAHLGVQQQVAWRGSGLWRKLGPSSLALRPAVAGTGWCRKHFTVFLLCRISFDCWLFFP